MLELKDVCFTASGPNGQVKVLDGINFKVDEGKVLVITGPNGGGKSTLAKIIMGINELTSGNIYFEGKEVTNLNITERAKAGIGYAFQAPPRFKGITVRKLLELSAGSKLEEKDACDYLSEVGLCAKEYLNREVDQSLSGGELKRIEIASLLARKPRLAIYDEPEAGIDLWSFSLLVDTFKKLASHKDQTIIIISHQERIIEFADEIMIIADGQVKAYGSKEEILPILKGDVAMNCTCNMSKVVKTSNE